MDAVSVSQRENTTDDLDPNTLWQQPLSDCFLPKQKDICHNGWTEKFQATYWSPLGQEIAKLVRAQYNENGKI